MKFLKREKVDFNILQIFIQIIFKIPKNGFIEIQK